MTFNRHVAPILFEHCAACHRPGSSGPFDLLTYSDARKRARMIAQVTAARQMPPWLPEPGHGDFIGERRLSDAQVSTLARWAEQAAPEGDPADLPPPPRFADGWALGPPDLVLTLPEPYTLPAEAPGGGDVYRNFVLPVPPSALPSDRYVRAVELRPGSPKVVHHAFILTDRTGESRALDEQDPEPGFAGMSAGAGAQSPHGHFLSWQPGKVRPEVSDDTAWRLRPGTDVVVQTHLRPGGKPEGVRPSVGLYLTDEPPTKLTLKLALRSLKIDIPPGATDYAVEDRYLLPVAAEVLSVLPHAHYLGKDLSGWAELPDGSRRWLIRIRQWDFNWQEHYTFKSPVALPAGTVLRMRYTYDNSAANPRNPNRPPVRVTFGQRTADEMGELWLQVRPYSRFDEQRLKGHYYREWVLPDSLASCEIALARSPDDPGVLTDYAATLIEAGRPDQALSKLHRALEVGGGGSARAHYYLGLVHSRLGESSAGKAKAAYEAALAVDPKHTRSLNNLGLLLLREGKAGEAEALFLRALQYKPDDAKAYVNLGLVAAGRGDPAKAAEHFEQALRIDPDEEAARQNLEKVWSRMRKGGG